MKLYREGNKVIIEAEESAVLWVKTDDGRPIFIYLGRSAAAPAPDAPAAQNQVPPA
jgi:hypothetical protein